MRLGDGNMNNGTIQCLVHEYDGGERPYQSSESIGPGKRA